MQAPEAKQLWERTYASGRVVRRRIRKVNATTVLFREYDSRSWGATASMTMGRWLAWQKWAVLIQEPRQGSLPLQ